MDNRSSMHTMMLMSECEQSSEPYLLPVVGKGTSRHVLDELWSTAAFSRSEFLRIIDHNPEIAKIIDLMEQDLRNMEEMSREEVMKVLLAGMATMHRMLESQVDSDALIRSLRARNG